MAEYESFHHEVLHRLVAGAAGITTADLQLLYDATAPIIYHGSLEQPLEGRRYRRSILTELREAGRISSAETPRGRVWTPTTIPTGLDVRHVAREARADGEDEPVVDLAGVTGEADHDG